MAITTYSSMLSAGIIRADADESNADMVATLFELLASVPADVLSQGFVFRAGWSAYAVGHDDDGLRLRCPDFLGDVKNWSADLSLAVGVEADQQRLLHRLGLTQGDPAQFGHRVTLVGGAEVLDADRMLLRRTAPADDGDSGWLIGAADGGAPATETGPSETAAERASESTASEWSAINVYRLLQLRPAILPALALPEGFTAVVGHPLGSDAVDALLSVTDPAGSPRPI